MAGSLLRPGFAGLITSGKVALPPSQPPSQAEFYYSCGYLDTVVNDRRILGNKGGGPGASARLDIFPDLNWVSIVLSNYDTTINPIVELARELITSLNPYSMLVRLAPAPVTVLPSPTTFRLLPHRD